MIAAGGVWCVVPVEFFVLILGLGLLSSVSISSMLWIIMFSPVFVLDCLASAICTLFPTYLFPTYLRFVSFSHSHTLQSPPFVRIHFLIASVIQTFIPDLIL